ncbi:MAG: NTP transferase domain-containing protein [Clostridiales bacterium]|nr:NTP transferase domain-containing protein [Clostridiales bacterium]
MDKLNAIVLAGGNSKAFLLINGKPMVEYVIDALCDAKYIGNIIAVGEVDKLKPLLGRRVTRYIQGGDTLIESVKRGIKPLNGLGHVLIITSDIPMIKAHIIDDFIESCMEKPLDIHYPIVERRVNEKSFPGVRRTYVKLKEGEFTGGNILYIAPSVIERCEIFISQVIANRKRPLKIGRLLGYKFLILLLLGQMRISMIERRLYDLLGIRGRAHISYYGEIVNDVDNISDIQLITRFF